MAFSKVPTDWVAGISEDGTDLIIPLASIPGLTAAAADAENGDIRYIFRGLCAMQKAGQDAQDIADLPVRMKISTVDMPLSDGFIRKVYSSVFDNEVTAEEVADEVADE